MSINDNKLIAEFIGRAGKHNENLYTFIGLVNISPSSYAWYRLEDAKFDSSWDWLMLVVKKIKLMGEDLESWRMITNPSDYEQEKVFNQVVEFIKWYNKNK